MLTLIVSNLDSTRKQMRRRKLTLGPASGGEFATIAQILDPDGNQITFAEPGPAQHQNQMLMQIAHPGG
jgi:hypothetical protein